jgi:hypothetical protein
MRDTVLKKSHPYQLIDKQYDYEQFYTGDTSQYIDWHACGLDDVIGRPERLSRQTNPAQPSYNPH